MPLGATFSMSLDQHVLVSTKIIGQRVMSEIVAQLEDDVPRGKGTNIILLGLFNVTLTYEFNCLLHHN